MTTRLALLVTALLLIFNFSGCKTESGLGGDGPVALTVRDITPTSDPFGDVYDGSSGLYRPDTVTVVFQNDLLNQSIVPTSMTDVIIRTYRVSFVRTDGGSAVPAAFQENINVSVPTNSTATIENLTIVRATQKQQNPLYYLTPFSLGYEPDTGYNNISCNVLLEFWGETIAGDRIYASGSIGITFADYAN
jgi:hypothetical protein